MLPIQLVVVIYCNAMCSTISELNVYLCFYLHNFDYHPLTFLCVHVLHPYVCNICILILIYFILLEKYFVSNCKSQAYHCLCVLHNIIFKKSLKNVFLNYYNYMLFLNLKTAKYFRKFGNFYVAKIHNKL